MAAKYAADWPAWGHRKIRWLMAADGYTASASSVQRAMRRRGLLQPIDYQGQRRELAKARKAAFADPPDGPNQVWQLDFSEYETTTGGTWRLAGVTDYFTKYEHGWHIAPTCTGADAIAAVSIAIAEAEQLAGCSLAEALTDPGHRADPPDQAGHRQRGRVQRDRIRRGSSPPGPSCCTSARARKSPGQNGVRERAFGSLKYEHLYRLEIADLPTLAREAEVYRQIFNHIRPHEALGGHRPIEVYQDPSLHPQLSKPDS